MFSIRSFAFATLLGLFTNTYTYAQSMEQRFQDVFITAGYSTAFGAALGAASIALGTGPGGAEDNYRNLDPIAQGASIGFILGSAMGSYVVFSPMFQVNIAENKTSTFSTALAMVPSQSEIPSVIANFRLEIL